MVDQKELELVADLDCNWHRIKQTLQDAINILSELALILPTGVLKSIVIGLIGGINLLINWLPDCKESNE